MEFFSAIKLHTCTFPLTVLCGFPEKITKCVEQIAGNANIMQRHWHLTKYTTTYYNLPTIIQEYCPIFGLEITKAGTPELYTLLQDVGAICDSISDRAKQEYKRTRPFVYYNQQTLVPEQEESHINNGSYPSGHTVLDMDNVLVDFKNGLDRVPEDIKAKYADDGTQVSYYQD